MQKGTMRRGLFALLAVAGVTAGTGIASAADIQRPVYKAPPAGVMPVAYDWTGFYVGGHVGYGWADKSWQDGFGLFGISQQANGFLGGGQAGFNYQVGQFVFGVEGDMSWSGMKGSTNTLASSFNTDVDWTATLTGRLGMAFDRWLVYGKGGAAWARDRYTTNFYTFPGTEVTDTRLGWTAGAGVFDISDQVFPAYGSRWSAIGKPPLVRRRIPSSHQGFSSSSSAARQTTLRNLCPRNRTLGPSRRRNTYLRGA